MSTRSLLVHRQSMLSRMLRLPGYIGDVASLMLWIARQYSEQGVTECRYGRVVIHAHACASPEEVERAFHRACKAPVEETVTIGMVKAMRVA